MNECTNKQSDINFALLFMEDVLINNAKDSQTPDYVQHLFSPRMEFFQQQPVQSTQLNTTNF